MKNLVKSVLEYIKNNNIEPTPQNYQKVFCQEAKKVGFEVEECNKLAKIASKLSNEEREEFNKLEFKNIDILIDFLVQKLRNKEKELAPTINREILTQKTVDRLASLIAVSLTPTFDNDDISNDLKKFSQEIVRNPEILNDDSVQKDIEEFIEKRVKNDKEIITDKTNKMTTLLNKMNDFIDTTVSKSDVSIVNLSNISNDLKSLEFDDIDKSSFVKFRDKIIKISDTLESEVVDLSSKLKKEQEDVTILKSRIKDLEENLKNAKLQCSVDFLTGVLTRREFDKRITSLEKMYYRYGDGYIIVFLDLDDFKKINDTYGHDAGDFVLSTFASILKKRSHKDFIVSRYGGEEFLVALPKFDKTFAIEKMQEIKNLVDQNSFEYNNIRMKVTFSAGIVDRKDFKDIDSMFKKADELLYKAKNSGKDRLEF